MIAPPPLSNDCFALPRGVDWTPVSDALAHLKQNLHGVTKPEEVSLPNLNGRVTAAPLVALADHPPFTNSAVDGFGFAHGSIGEAIARLPLIEGEAAAGRPYPNTVPKAHAIRVLTGAKIPDGVDTVILQEDVTRGAQEIAFHAGLSKGANTRVKAEDIRTGETLLAQGHRIRPNDLGALASGGHKIVSCRQKLRVGVLATGDEVGNDDVGGIPDANRHALLALLSDWGHEAIDLGICPDSIDELRERFDQAAKDCDAILTTGGASTGDEDHVAAILRQEATLYHWRIAIKPGRPLALANWRGIPVFGLPGNPVAAFVCTVIFAHPALALMAGHGWREPFLQMLPAAFSKNKKAGRSEFLRARQTASGALEVFPSEGSGRVSSLSFAQGLIHLGPEAQQIKEGDLLPFQPFSSLS